MSSLLKMRRDGRKWRLRRGLDSKSVDVDKHAIDIGCVGVRV